MQKLPLPPVPGEGHLKKRPPLPVLRPVANGRSTRPRPSSAELPGSPDAEPSELISEEHAADICKQHNGSPYWAPLSNHSQLSCSGAFSSSVQSMHSDNSAEQKDEASKVPDEDKTTSELPVDWRHTETPAPPAQLTQQPQLDPQCSEGHPLDLSQFGIGLQRSSAASTLHVDPAPQGPAQLQASCQSKAATCAPNASLSGPLPSTPFRYLSIALSGQGVPSTPAPSSLTAVERWGVPSTPWPSSLSPRPFGPHHWTSQDHLLWRSRHCMPTQPGGVAWQQVAPAPAHAAAPLTPASRAGPSLPAPTLPTVLSETPAAPKPKSHQFISTEALVNLRRNQQRQQKNILL